MTEEFGGFFDGRENLSNPNSLEYVLEAIQGPIYGQELYPTMIEKAAALGWQIIEGHVFHDGNKRTGMETCRLFLDLNGYAMRIDQEVVSMALQIATKQVQFPDFVHWVAQRTAEIPQDAAGE